ncbi:methyltransferase [Nocardiopsis terrae]|uniref:SAM-dependent methyltransferase n=1 Tax=Nocardiopsis terrae TaxID=372655 RepID=A0ABR9HIE3_9ACTN|nr:class I SAM-dependent methyltransferase [Nocardiopsis terrae]MBE1458789.1 SAM-dependent methyltransferase [Nocardiopsis terrae]GHC86325.1 methyltransferase [Nocardiopsis terrae]
MHSADFLAATRASYDAIAEPYAARFHDEFARKPLDRALLTAFAETVTGPVADVGCGPGRVTAYLHSLGLDVFGIDLSPGMLGLARAANPGLRFVRGSMTDLDLPDASLGGLVAMYSTIHVPLEDLPGVFEGFRRVLCPGGQAFVVFQAGDETVHFDEGFGHGVDLDFHFRPPELIADLLEGAGLRVTSRTVREAQEGERSRHAYLWARRPD